MVVTWPLGVVVDDVGGGKTNQCCLFVVCGAKLNVGVCRESTWASTDLLNDYLLLISNIYSGFSIPVAFLFVHSGDHSSD